MPVCIHPPTLTASPGAFFSLKMSDAKREPVTQAAVILPTMYHSERTSRDRRSCSLVPDPYSLIPKPHKAVETELRHHPTLILSLVPSQLLIMSSWMEPSPPLWRKNPDRKSSLSHVGGLGGFSRSGQVRAQCLIWS